MRSFVTIVGLLLMLAASAGLEDCGYLRPLRQSLQSDVIPAEMINCGSFGRVVSRLGLFQPVPNDFTRFVRTDPFRSDGEASIFQKKRVVGDFLFEPLVGEKRGFLSSQLPVRETKAKGWSVISIVVDQEDLAGPDGIFTNMKGRGRQYERLANVSYYEDGQLRFSTYAGIRLHGGNSRKNLESYRIYFRKEYGVNRIDPDFLFSDSDHSVKRLVVRMDRPQQTPFTTCLAFDIAKRLGSTVPQNKPVLCYFNGKYGGNYYLSEHLSRRQWKEHIGHGNFDFYRYKSTSDYVSEMNYHRSMQLIFREDRLTMESVAKQIDVENFTGFMMAMAFCGTTDGLQGVALRDKIEPQSRWSWIHWDMDHSFQDVYRHKSDDKERPPWEQDAMELGFPRGKKNHNYRTVLFSRLIREDPIYRRYFVKRFVDSLNHLISEEFFEERLDYYQELAKYERIGEGKLQSKRAFLAHRPNHIRSQLERYFGSSPFYRCEVRGPVDTQLLIDGYREFPGFTGYYPKEIPIEIELTDRHARHFSHWLINGEPVYSKDVSMATKLSLSVTEDVTILPVFD